LFAKPAGKEMPLTASTENVLLFAGDVKIQGRVIGVLRKY
jgi:hypothetical protein